MAKLENAALRERYEKHARYAVPTQMGPTFSGRISRITGEELQVRFLWGSEENSLKY
jgi:hypothetical protein